MNQARSGVRSAPDRLEPASSALRIDPLVLGGIVALFASRVWGSDEPLTWGHSAVTTVAAALLSVVFCVRLWLGRTRKMQYAGLDFLFLLFAWWSLQSSILNPTFRERGMTNAFYGWIGLLLMWRLIREATIERVAGRGLALTLVVLGASLSVLGGYQKFVEMPAKRQAFEERRLAYLANPELMLRETGVVVSPEDMPAFLSRLGSPEVFATFSLANSFAGLLAVSSTVALGLALRSSQAGAARGPALMWWSLWGLQFLALGWTHSRTALAAVLLGAGYLVLRRFLPVYFSPLRAVCWIFGGALGVGAALFQFRNQDVLRNAWMSLTFRFEYWVGAWRMALDSPWFGCGPGGFQDEYTRYKLPQAAEVVSDPHNFLMETAAVFGFPAALLLLAALAFWFGSLSQRTENDEPQGMLDDRWYLWLWPVGIACGGIFGSCVAVGQGLPVWPWVVVLSAGLGLFATWTCRDWLRSDDYPREVFAAAAVVGWINLGFSGGLMFPGVADSLWLVMALASPAAIIRYESVKSRKKTALLFLPSGLCVLYFCYFHVVLPMQNRDLHMAAARHASDPFQALNSWVDAAHADRLSLEPLLELARMTQDACVKTGNQPEDRKSLRIWIDAAISNAPRSASLRFSAGKLYADLDDQVPDQETAELAAQHFGEAVERYPNSAPYRAAWAERLARIRKYPEAAVQAAEAVRLDDLMPHANLKLPADQRKAMENMAGRER